MNQIDPEVRRRRIETLVKLAGLCGVAFIVSPFIFVAIKGLIGMIIAASIGCKLLVFSAIVPMNAD